ncbi:MAG: ISAzo13 family transposase [Candidatus Parabeggiatoa sp.]|nr:ISAzo13 family transposase [Candidatus Parabeggiatoa sp.]
MSVEEQLREKYIRLFSHFNEKQKRLLAAYDAIDLGHGGVSLVSRASNLTRPTIYRGIKELTLATYDSPDFERVRKCGGGRKNITDEQPNLLLEIDKLLDVSTRGDPESPLKWTCKSTRTITDELNKKGFVVSKSKVYDLLVNLDYSMQSNAKTLEGSDHPDRDKQFKYINRNVKRFIKNGNPVISVDAKKKENIGNYDNKGKRWQPKGNPKKVQGHDFPDKEQGKVIPYGIYDINNNFGMVNVGCDHDTSAFAVASIKNWWRQFGKKAYPKSKALLICADAGGSNSYRYRLWKFELKKFAEEENLSLTVLHFPPGTSKWNKIEHRLFSHISMNWKGQPLTSHEVVLNLISATKTKTGLKVHANLDTNKYPTKVKVSDEEMKSINLKKHKFHGEWNYTINS